MKVVNTDFKDSVVACGEVKRWNGVLKRKTLEKYVKVKIHGQES
jgi:hypothetical protein